MLFPSQIPPNHHYGSYGFRADSNSSPDEVVHAVNFDASRIDNHSSPKMDATRASAVKPTRKKMAASTSRSSEAPSKKQKVASKPRNPGLDRYKMQTG